MKRSVLIALVIVCSASMALAQAGAIDIFADPGMTSCNFVDAGSLVQVYFGHMHHGSATASQFKLDLGGLPWTHLGDTWNFTTIIGTSVTGVSIGYGSCQAAPTVLGNANFFGSASPVCSLIRIVPDPGSLSGLIEGVDCGTPAVKTFPQGGAGRVNDDGSCTCTTPVEETTWGGVKALYQ